jgi:hypothetical protein
MVLIVIHNPRDICVKIGALSNIEHPINDDIHHRSPRNHLGWPAFPRSSPDTRLICLTQPGRSMQRAYPSEADGYRNRLVACTANICSICPRHADRGGRYEYSPYGIIWIYTNSPKRCTISFVQWDGTNLPARVPKHCATWPFHSISRHPRFWNIFNGRISR